MEWVSDWKRLCECFWGADYVLFLDLDPGLMCVFSL